MQKSIGSADHKRLGLRLRDLRRGLGLSQQELADRLEVDQTFVSKVERGERRLDLMELRSVCQALDIDLVDLVSEFR